MGNLRSVEKAFERVGARAVLTADHDRAARGGRADPARRRGVPRGDGAAARRRGSTSCCTSAPRPASRSSASAWACSCSSTARPSTAGPRASGCIPGTVRQLEAPGLKLPHIGWSDVRWDRRLAAARRAARPGRLLPRALLRPAPRRRGRRARRERLRRRRSPASSARGSVFGVQFHPEKSSRDGLRMLANFAALAAGRPHDPLPGDRHPRRPGRAPRPGRLRRPRPSTATPAGGGPRAGSTAGARFLHVVDLDGAKSGEPANLEHVAAIDERARRARCSSAAACATLASVARRARRRRRARHPRDGGAARRRPARRLPRVLPRAA